jgi:hypothetical protein
MDGAIESKVIGDNYTSADKGEFWGSSEEEWMGKRFKFVFVSCLNYFSQIAYFGFISKQCFKCTNKGTGYISS